MTVTNQISKFFLLIFAQLFGPIYAQFHLSVCLSCMRSVDLHLSFDSNDLLEKREKLRASQLNIEPRPRPAWPLLIMVVP